LLASGFHQESLILRRFLLRLLPLAVVGLTLSSTLAQNGTQAAVGDPPVASLISITAPDADGIVTIEGAPGAVFPGAQVAIRNLYTEQIIYTQAGITGGFSATIYGPSNTPFWISPAGNIPNNLRNLPGSLPGGPGTIMYGAFSEPQSDDAAATRLVTDGDDAEWSEYPDATLLTTPEHFIRGLLNQDSLYVAINDDNMPADYWQLQLEFSLDEISYRASLDPRLEQLATLQRISPSPNDLGTVAIAASQDAAIEMRISLISIVGEFNPTIETATIEGIRFIAVDGTELSAYRVEQSVPLVAEVDGAVQLNSPLEDVTRFIISGSVAQGASTWTARGRISPLSVDPGDEMVMEMDVTLNAPGLAEGLIGLRMLGQVGLQPVMNAEGLQAAGGLNSNNGWSNLLTPSGLAIANVRGDLMLGEAVVPGPQVIRRGSQLLFAIRFTLTIPDDLPPGMYVPVFQGFGQVGDGEMFQWQDNGVLGTGTGISRLPLTRLPVVLNVGGVNSGRLVWSLFYDNPSEGSRGLLSSEDQEYAALSNRVRFDSPTYILPPGTSDAGYSIEPYLLNQMPNAYDTTSAPLIPFLFPGGRLVAQVTRPDNTVDDLGSVSIIQNQLSTAAMDERLLFGAQSPLDVYRLTTLNQLFTHYQFDEYGQYEIQLTGNLEDIWGNRYEGGGTYSLLIAELLDMTPGVLPGTPFEVGNAFNPGLRLAPGVPADVTITVRVYPLDGSTVVEQAFEGQANIGGYFHAAGEGFNFEVPGEYIIDYEARYTDSAGRLWAGSLRSAGVIANPDGTLIAHGQRGLDGFDSELRPAWFTTLQYGEGDAAPRLNYPYHAGDVAWVADGPSGGLKPVLEAQDDTGAYETWLTTTYPESLNMRRQAAEDELPLGIFSPPDNRFGVALVPERIVNNAYSYLSAVRPDVTARQFVQGGVSSNLLSYWDADSPYNGQIGTGVNGDLPGDYLFLFGGVVVRNEAAQVQDTAIYAALAVVIDGENDALGPRVYPPFRGEAGGPNGGALMVVNNAAVNMFFHPTGIQPGQVLAPGDTLAVAGQVAPTLASIVSVRITSPSGVARQFEGVANAIGYFYNPANDFAVNEVGVWTVEIRVRHEGTTSAGVVEPPPPTGGILGTVNGSFQVYVLPPDAQSLPWELDSVIAISPTAPYNFTFRLPEDWESIQVYATVTTPSYVLENGPLRPSGSSFSYQYNTTRLSDVTPTLENNPGGSGPASSDVVTITFVISGIDLNGQTQIRSRTFTLMYDRMMTFQ
jgi:hypothetical protein